MKYLITIIISTVFCFSMYAQETDTTQSSSDTETSYEIINEDSEEVEIITDEIVKEGKPDTTDFKLGDTEFRIIEDEDETSLTIKEKKGKDGESKDWNWDDDSFMKSNSNKFKGHWAGFEFGLNNYVDKDFSISRTAENEFMDINTGRSWNFNLNFAQFSVPFVGNKFGMLTGLGIEWSNYHFSNSNSILKNTTTRQVEPLQLIGTIKMNRLQTTYLTIPLLMELQLLEGERSDRFFISGGVIAGLKIGSHTKYKISETGGVRSEKDKDDYYLSPFRYGITARAGYKLVKVYFNYYLTPLFINGRGPELYPVAMGLSLAF